MPKVSRKDAKDPLQEVSMAMDTETGFEGAESLPAKPAFAQISAQEAGQKVEFRRVSAAASSMHHAARQHLQHPLTLCLRAQIPVPQHRMTPLKTHWMELYTPITENLKLDMRMNLKTKKVGEFTHMFATAAEYFLVPNISNTAHRLKSRQLTRLQTATSCKKQLTLFTLTF